MALPKRRHTRSRQNKRRSQQGLTQPALSTCSQCGRPKVPHRVCPYCGYYKGAQVLEVKEKKKKEKLKA